MHADLSGCWTLCGHIPASLGSIGCLARLLQKQSLLSTGTCLVWRLTPLGSALPYDMHGIFSIMKGLPTCEAHCTRLPSDVPQRIPQLGAVLTLPRFSIALCASATARLP